MTSFDVLASAASGGALGLLGNLANGVLGYFQKRQDQRHLLDRLHLEHAGLKLQANADAARLAGELAAAREKGAAAAFDRSIAAEQAVGVSYRWVHAVRSLTRPGLTWFFVATAVLIVLLPERLAQANALQEYAAITVVNLAYMVTAWWFGQRQIEKTTRQWGNAVVSAHVDGRAQAGR